MYRSNSARIVPIIIFVVVSLALILGLVAVGRYIFGGGSATTDDTVVQARDELLTVNVDRSVHMTIRGPIVADENFRTYQVVVSPAEREYTVYSGYRDEVVSRDTFGNNTRAYEQFVYALDKAAMTKPGKYTESEASDIRGICATGRVYEFELYDGDNQIQRYWTSTCGGSPGTLGASVQQITNLFSAQITGVKLEYASSFNQPSL